MIDKELSGSSENMLSRPQILISFFNQINEHIEDLFRLRETVMVFVGDVIGYVIGYDTFSTYLSDVERKEVVSILVENDLTT